MCQISAESRTIVNIQTPGDSPRDDNNESEEEQEKHPNFDMGGSSLSHEEEELSMQVENLKKEVEQLSKEVMFHNKKNKFKNNAEPSFKK